MKSSESGRITDELLSAYIDNAVTEQERTLVESAASTDAEIAWRLDTLQQTVQMLRTLPELALPRSFVLQESQVRTATRASAGQAVAVQPASANGPNAGGWRAFWRLGSPIYRNLAAASLVLFLILVGGNTLMDSALTGTSAPAAEIAYSEPPAAAESPAEAAAVAAAPAEDSVGATAPEMRVQQSPTQELLTDESPAQTPLSESPPAEDIEPVANAAAAPPPQAAAAELPAAEGAAGEESAAEPLALEAPALLSAESAARAEPALAAAAAPALEGQAVSKAVPAGEEAGAELASIAAEPPPVDEAADGAEEKTLLFDEATDEGALGPPAEPASEVDVEEVEDAEEEGAGGEAVAALPAATATPQPTATAKPLAAAESPQTAAYPAPAWAPRFGVDDLTPPRVLMLALLIATIVFGGLWWRSRSGSGNA